MLCPFHCYCNLGTDPLLQLANHLPTHLYLHSTLTHTLPRTRDTDAVKSDANPQYLGIVHVPPLSMVNYRYPYPYPYPLGIHEYVYPRLDQTLIHSLLRISVRGLTPRPYFIFHISYFMFKKSQSQSQAQSQAHLVYRPYCGENITTYAYGVQSYIHAWVKSILESIQYNIDLKDNILGT
jgi:hypothetical protein